MPTNTYVALDKVTVGSATPSITFSSISQAYTDLVLVCSSTDSVVIYARLGNGSVDSGTNYSYTYLLGDGSTTASGRNSNVTKGYLSLSSDVAAKQYHTITNFQNYSNTTTYKTFLTRYSDTTIYSAAVVNLWRSTSAVNIITVYGDGGNIPAGSTFSLYGIAAEVGGSTPKATGGTVTSDSTYWYHAFTTSGNFVPNQTLSCDVLCIAGGGGTSAATGGGGAGGVIYATSQSLTATSYSALVGAGGALSTGGGVGNKGNNSSFHSLITANGGGAGTRTGGASANGGSGGGVANGYTAGTANAGSGGTGYANVGAIAGPNVAYGGGGGAGGAGSGSGVGGNGLNTWSSWASVTGTGVSGYYAGGGGGPLNSPNPGASNSGGAGGGGASGDRSPTTATAGTAGTINTGSGAGGGGVGNSVDGSGASGGSGIVIVRYAK